MPPLGRTIRIRQSAPVQPDVAVSSEYELANQDAFLWPSGYQVAQFVAAFAFPFPVRGRRWLEVALNLR